MKGTAFAWLRPSCHALPRTGAKFDERREPVNSKITTETAPASPFSTFPPRAVAVGTAFAYGAHLRQTAEFEGLGRDSRAILGNARKRRRTAVFKGFGAGRFDARSRQPVRIESAVA